MVFLGWYTYRAPDILNISLCIVLFFRIISICVHLHILLVVTL